MGNSAPGLFPYEPLPCADRELIVTAGNDSQFRKLCEVLGLPNWSRTRGSPTTRTARPTATQLRPLLVERLRTRTAHGVVPSITAAGVPCGPINTIDDGVAFADDIGLDPVVGRRRWAAAVPSVRHPITLSDNPVDYRPAARARRARRGDPALAGRTGGSGSDDEPPA